MSKMGFFAVGWLAGVASVVTAAIVADKLQQPDAIFEENDVANKIEGGGRFER